MSSTDACSARSEAIEVMRVERKRHVFHTNLLECECGVGLPGWVAWDAHVEDEVLDALLAARRTVPCATCGGRSTEQTDLAIARFNATGNLTQCPDCTDGMTDTGSLAVQWLVEAGVLAVMPGGFGAQLREVVSHVS